MASASHGDPGPKLDAGGSVQAPISLSGSVPDGELDFDAAGRLRPSRGLRRLFDYFLSATGEREPASIRRLLEAFLEQTQPAERIIQVMAEFDRYLSYHQALALLPPTTDLRARLEDLVRLRRSWFDATTADAYFADEERNTRYTLERLRLAKDRSLTEPERAKRLKSLADSVPEEQRDLVFDSTLAARVATETAQLDARSADARSRQAERAAWLGPAAAERLDQLDQERARWAARLASYREARDAIRADPGLAPAEISAALAALAASSFDPNERRRIESLESVGRL